jgi:hypothetical protein
MTKREIRIISYFSLPTDLAAEMRAWPEFVKGAEYSVELQDPLSGESVAVRYIEEDQEHFVSVTGEGSGALFDRVLGRVVYALSAHSDDLMLHRRSP